MHIGLVTDYVAVDFTNGPALATQAMRRHFEARGHQVTLVGPKPGRGNRAAAPGSLLLDSTDFRAHAGVRVPWPWPPRAYLERPAFDVVHSHANSLLMHFGPMLRELHGIPCINTNTIYLPAFAQHLLPNFLYEFKPFYNWYEPKAEAIENAFARVYGAGDGLIVQCEGLAEYWRGRGLEVPLHVIPRPIDLRVFGQAPGADPFRPAFPRGKRLLVVCRHAREKDVDRVIASFANHVLPHDPQASLTLVGDGPEHDTLKGLARTLGVWHRCHFAGETPQRDLPTWYAWADMFVYASMSETFGQVINEALWSGLPVVGVRDDMGVSHQVKHDVNGVIIEPGRRQDAEMGAAIRALLDNPERRRTLGEEASRRSKAQTHPEVVYQAYEDAYAAALEHIRAKPPARAHGVQNSTDARWLFSEHLWPWIWKHMAMSAIGSIRGNRYKPQSEVPFDAAPDRPARATGAQDETPAALRTLGDHAAEGLRAPATQRSQSSSRHTRSPRRATRTSRNRSA